MENQLKRHTMSIIQQAKLQKPVLLQKALLGHAVKTLDDQSECYEYDGMSPL
jgi:hypothetical protein